MNNNFLANKQANLSIMRILATVAVIFLHTCNTISNNASNYDLSDSSLLYFTTGNYLMNWAVPIFLMITGILLLDKEKKITYHDCIKKYSKRILLALIVFGIPFSMLEIIMTTKRISFTILWDAIINVITGKSWSHLWYLYALIGVYLVLPLLKAFVDKCSYAEIKTFLIVLFIFNFIIPIVNSIFKISIAFEIPIVSFTIFYLLLGYQPDKEMPSILCNKQFCAIALLGCIVLLIVANSYLLSNGNSYFNYNSPLMVVITILVFSLIKGIKVNSTERLWQIDRLCFGVYIVHPIFINFVYKFLDVTPLNAGRGYLFMTVVFWIIFVLCSFIASWVMGQIKPLKKYIL